MEKASHAERLAGEKSAYLRSAAHQPVDWHPWSDEPFQRARALDRPVLLDIGAVWCHWCHVMDRESYESEEIARIINERFVAVKVDRDERPDVDRRYQEAVGAITGQGGWPLTGFLTPDGKVFYGGTYFPPDDRHGRPGFASVLTQIADFYQTQRSDALKHADALFAQIRNAEQQQSRPGELDEALLDEAVESMSRAFDRRNGGFGGAPKFPHAAALELLLRRHARSEEPWLRTMFDTTLERMGKGGIRDHVGGGFHRYSVDERWIVPHFEKMLYDNAELLKNYAHAYSLTGNAHYREVGESILFWIDTVASHRETGGFCASQDADIDLSDDGDYFTWTADEARAVLNDEEFDVLALYYHIRPQGEMHHNPQKNVLFVDVEPLEIAGRRRLSEDRVRTIIREGTRKLYDGRQSRPTPFVDPTVYTGWNGMMASAYLRAAQTFGRADSQEFALTTLRRLMSDGFIAGKGMAHACPPAAGDGAVILDDQAHVARALLDAYTATADPAWLEQAEALMATTLERFWDEDRGGFFDRARDAPGGAVLQTRHKPLQDSPSASGNGAAASVLLELFELTGRVDYRDRAEVLLRAFAGLAPDLGYFAGAYLAALDECLHPPVHVLVAGMPGDPGADRLWDAALRTHRPVTLPQRLDPSLSAARHLPEALRAVAKNWRSGDDARAYVCAGTTCAAPVADPQALVELIRRMAAKPAFGPSGGA